MRTPSAKAAFTLIELLVVIAIVAVLVVILLPAVGSVRSSANKAGCISNLRQIGAAMYSYAGEHEGRLPPGYVNGVHTADNNWWFRLIPYLDYPAIRQGQGEWNYIEECSGSGALYCPEAESRDKGLFKSNGWVNFKMNQRYRVAGVGQGSGITYGALLSSVQPGSIMVAEGRQTSEFNSYVDEHQSVSNGVIYPHGGQINVLFGGGQVESLRRSDMEARWSTLYTNSIIN